MFCPECGCFLPEGTKVCKECGHRLKSAERGIVVEEQPLEAKCRSSVSPRARAIILENAFLLASVTLVLCSLFSPWTDGGVTGIDLMRNSGAAGAAQSVFGYTPIVVLVCMILTLTAFFLGRRPYLLVTGAVALFCIVIFAIHGHHSGIGILLTVAGCLFITIIGLRNIAEA